MSYTLSAKSEARLAGVHPDLVKVVRRALQLTTVDFAVVEGLRTVERQRELVAKGASLTLKSRHITGHAVDLAPVIDGSIRWDWPAFYPVIEAMRRASKELGIPMVHGADWVTLKDGPHHELDRLAYPA